MRCLGKLFLVCVLVLLARGLWAAGLASHVVVVVWDGMRPDFVNKRYTPTLARLATEGVTFANHHSVYISSTEVNGAVFATGVYPAQNGIIGNKEYRPALDLANPVMTAAEPVVRRGDAVTAGHFLPVMTLAEFLHARGLRTAIAGAKTVTILHDRLAQDSHGLGADVSEGQALPSALYGVLQRVLGPFPAVRIPKTKRDKWTTRALVGPLWSDGVPPFSLLWLSEPDYTQHHTGPGSEQSLAALKSSDDNLARVLKALKRRGLRQQTDVIVISDHAFSTIVQSIDVAKELTKGGFRAYRQFTATGPQKDEVMVVGNGGTAFLYVIGHEPALVEKIVHFLQAQSFAGVLFTREPVAGAFSLAQAHINSVDAPDIVLSLRWSSARNEYGARGLVISDVSEYGPGQGMHASLSPYDSHNTCIAVGPDFRRGYRDSVPTGNIDLVPTVLAILGLEPTSKLSGRVLTEALVTSRAPEPEAHHTHLEASWTDAQMAWRQYLDSSEVSGVTYFDSGNGQQRPVQANQSKGD